eukprot:GAHX01001064.1.p1 GENE.GAHX01001064.1~~GAHX01001064.1.p1  ORF type:complete len:140 (+),score=34.54 GAHX01001064.1:44-421(+)
MASTFEKNQNIKKLKAAESEAIDIVQKAKDYRKERLDAAKEEAEKVLVTMKTEYSERLVREIDQLNLDHSHQKNVRFNELTQNSGKMHTAYETKKDKIIDIIVETAMTFDYQRNKPIIEAFLKDE